MSVLSNTATGGPTDTATLTEYRDAVRAMLGPTAAAATGASPIHPFVLSSPAFDAAVAGYGPDGGPVVPVHLSQEIRVHRLLRPAEQIRIDLDILGARREGRGSRLAMGCAVTATDGSPIADLVTGVLLVGTTAVEPFGDIPPYPAPAGTGVGEPAVVSLRPTRAAVRRYAEVSGDHNPIHLDDDAARAAGFAGVIAHGMSVLALVCEAAIDRYAGGDPARIRSIGCRFSAPVRPDEQLDVKFQPDTTGQLVKFSCGTPQGAALKSGWISLGAGDE